MATLAPEVTCKRKRIRLPYMAAVELTTSEGQRIRGNLRDIGLDSVFIKTDIDLCESSRSMIVEVAMTITQGDSSMTICTHGKIIRTDKDGCAVQFSEPLKWWPVFSLFPINDHFMFDLVSNT